MEENFTPINIVRGRVSGESDGTSIKSVKNRILERGFEDKVRFVW